MVSLHQKVNALLKVIKFTRRWNQKRNSNRKRLEVRVQLTRAKTRDDLRPSSVWEPATLTSDVKQRKQRTQHNRLCNSNISHKTKKSFSCFYTGVNSDLDITSLDIEAIEHILIGWWQHGATAERSPALPKSNNN